MATAFLDPDGTFDMLLDFFGAPTAWEAIDDGVRQPNTDTIMADFVVSNIDGRSASFTMEDVDLEGGTVTQIKVWIYAVNNDDEGESKGWEGDISLDEGTNWEGVQSFEIPLETTGWFSIILNGNFSQAEINALAVKLIVDTTGGANQKCYEMYAEITYGVPPVAGKSRGHIF